MFGIARHLAGAESGLDQRGEGFDVRAHDDHVARLQRRVVCEQVQDLVAEDFDLAGAAVARVDPDALVHRGELVALGGSVGADVGLDSSEQRSAGLLDGMVYIVMHRFGQHELHLPGVLAPGRQQTVGRDGRRRVFTTTRHRFDVREL